MEQFLRVMQLYLEMGIQKISIVVVHSDFAVKFIILGTERVGKGTADRERFLSVLSFSLSLSDKFNWFSKTSLAKDSENDILQSFV